MWKCDERQLSWYPHSPNKQSEYPDDVDEDRIAPHVVFDLDLVCPFQAEVDVGFAEFRLVGDQRTDRDRTALEAVMRVGERTTVALELLEEAGACPRASAWKTQERGCWCGNRLPLTCDFNILASLKRSAKLLKSLVSPARGEIVRQRLSKNLRQLYPHPQNLPDNAPACAGKRMRTEHSGRRAPGRSRSGARLGDEPPGPALEPRCRVLPVARKPRDGRRDG